MIISKRLADLKWVQWFWLMDCWANSECKRKRKLANEYIRLIDE